MSHLPDETWRLCEWLTIEQAAFLVANIDPQTSEVEMSDAETKHVAICRAAVWETARVTKDEIGVRIAHETGPFERDDYEDETASRVSATWLKQWLASKGVTSGFFFPKPPGPSEAFMDPSHEHFSPELAFAVLAWRALENQRRFPSSPKSAIAEWIENNPALWAGDEPISRVAKDRISTVVNWSKTGGAPRTGG